MNPIVVTTTLLPRQAAGMTVWPFMFLRPASRSDQGLIEHELVHWREQAKSPLWWPRYLLSKKFRQAAELRAYRRQIAVGGLGASSAAYFLATAYRLNLSYAEALRLLTSQPEI